MWFLWLMFAIPLSIITIGLMYALHKVYLKMEKEKVEYEQWEKEYKEKGGRYDENRN